MQEDRLPTQPEAEELLAWAAGRNPGPWVDHSKTAARAARQIAMACGMNPERCHVLGLLHDIGRYEGATALRHVLAGHDLMLDRGYAKAAQVCLTHSFPDKDINQFSGAMDCDAEQLGRIRRLLEQAAYDDEIRLIQLCDAISLTNGVCLMEKRLVDVALRHGVHDGTMRKWQSFLALKEYFDKRCGFNLYSLFRQEIISSLLS